MSRKNALLACHSRLQICMNQVSFSADFSTCPPLSKPHTKSRWDPWFNFLDNLLNGDRTTGSLVTQRHSSHMFSIMYHSWFSSMIQIIPCDHYKEMILLSCCNGKYPPVLVLLKIKSPFSWQNCIPIFHITLLVRFQQ